MSSWRLSFDPVYIRLAESLAECHHVADECRIQQDIFDHIECTAVHPLVVSSLMQSARVSHHNGADEPR
jgi:hypothetical protein